MARDDNFWFDQARDNKLRAVKARRATVSERSLRCSRVEQKWPENNKTTMGC